MLYSIEGVPKTEKFTLPTGEEIELNLKQGGGGEEDENGDYTSQNEEVFSLSLIYYLFLWVPYYCGLAPSSS